MALGIAVGDVRTGTEDRFNYPYISIGFVWQDGYPISENHMNFGENRNIESHSNFEPSRVLTDCH